MCPLYSFSFTSPGKQLMPGLVAFIDTPNELMSAENRSVPNKCLTKDFRYCRHRSETIQTYTTL